MKHFTLIVVLLISLNTYAQSSHWTSQHTSMALRSYEDLEKNCYYFLQDSNITPEQQPNINNAINKYYNALLKCNADFNNDLINKKELVKLRSIAYYNYNIDLKGIISVSQFELYQRFGHYSKSEEKKMIKYLKKHGVLIN